MRISLLPEELRVDLSSAGTDWTGLTGVVRPLDIEEFAGWLERFGDDDAALTGAIDLVKKQLVRVEPVDVEGQPFDPKNPKHFRAVFSKERQGFLAVRLMYDELLSRTRLSGEAEKNSSSPSDSVTASSSEG